MSSQTDSSRPAVDVPDTSPDGNGSSPKAERPSPSPGGHAPEHDDLWYYARALKRRWKLITIVTVLVAGLSVWIALLLPDWYRSEARLLQPTDSGGMSSLIQSFAPEAAALLDEGGGDYTRYIAILTSRTVLSRTVDRFDLVEVYETEDTLDPYGEAILSLRGNTEFEIDLEYGYLSVSTLDKDPERAAAITNYLVGQLNDESTRLSSQSAREQRRFLGRRLDQAESDMDSVKTALQQFQESSGVVALEAQSEAFLTSLGPIQQRVAELEIQYEALRSQYGAENPQTVAAREARNAARQRMNEILSGSEALMPVDLDELPRLGRQYADLQQELLIQGEIIQLIRPLYEKAALDEQRDQSAVQVLDPAVAPVRKAKPTRSILCIVATLSGFALACAYVLALAWARFHGPQIATRLRTS